MIVKKEIAANSEEFLKLCKDHHVSELYAFGSATTDEFDAHTSDIDLLVDINEPDPLKRGEAILSLWDAFEKFFKRKVDLLTKPSLRNPYLKNSIEKTKVLIYDGKSAQVFV
jgi:predicted nucleotidyltransferase